MEEKLRQEREIALEEGYARREAEEAAGACARASLTDPRSVLTATTARAQAQTAAGQGYVPAPSPTHVARPHLRHERKDSDTMRGGSGSPTAVEASRLRRSPTAMDAQPQHKQAHWEEGELQQPPIQATKSAPAPLAAAPSQSGGNGGGAGGSGGSPGEGLILTAEEIKDVVSSTALWLVVREGFGGVGRVSRKGDGSWRIR